MKNFLLIVFSILFCFQLSAGENVDSTALQRYGDPRKDTLVITPKLFVRTDTNQIQIGEYMPAGNIDLKDVSGVNVQLKQLVLPNGLLIIFSCNTCPFVLGWEDRYNNIAAYCKANDIGMIVLNSNEGKRTEEDSYPAMVAHAKEKGYNFYYAVDKNHEVADMFRATKTPDVFLFDKHRMLVYKGAIDDNMKEPENVQEPYLMNALENMVTGKAIDPSVTKSIGCSIKRVVQ